MVVYKDKKGHFFFFGNTVAWCLGHNPPHEAIHNLVDSRHKHSVPFGSGIFLDNVGVQQLIEATDGETLYFRNWYDQYIQSCHKDFTIPSCPHV